MTLGPLAANGRQPGPRRMVRAWLIGLLAISSFGGCSRGVPTADTTAGVAAAASTITGTVRSPRGTTAVDGRIVEVVNLDTGERRRLTTNTAGGFSLRLRPGKYRVELALRDGESLLGPPAVIDLNRTALNRRNLNRTDLQRSGLDAHVDLVVGTVRGARPRGPGYRTEYGLGSPIG